MKSLLQTQEWADLKVEQGWKSHNIDGVFILEKKLTMGRSFLYAPEVEYRLLNTKIYENTKEIAKLSHSIFTRLEIIDENNTEIIKNLKENGFIKAFEELQPEWRQIIDISKSEEEILAQMKQKGRYNIKVAQKHNVEVSVCPIDRLVDGVKIFYDLYCQTAGYQGISHRNYKYFYKMMQALYSKSEAAVLIARYDNVPLAALIITFYDGVASYLYGGTSRLHKEVMSPYAAHFEAIKLAKEKGCIKYDLLAVAPESLQTTDHGLQQESVVGSRSAVSNHKYANLTRFKEQFGGRKVNIVGSYDYVYKPTWYKMFKMAEKLRRN